MRLGSGTRRRGGEIEVDHFAGAGSQGAELVDAVLVGSQPYQAAGEAIDGDPDVAVRAAGVVIHQVGGVHAADVVGAELRADVEGIFRGGTRDREGSSRRDAQPQGEQDCQKPEGGLAVFTGGAGPGR